MYSNRVVRYLARINSCDGTRQKPELLFVTRGEKENSLLFHTKENRKFFQYRQKSVNLKSIVLMCIYKQNSRFANCNAFITVKLNREGLIISKMGERENRFYSNFEGKSAKIHFLIRRLYLQMINFTPNFAWNKSHFIYERSKFEILRTPENITDDAVPETFIHLSQKTENMIPCYFPSELSKLNYKDLYFDGTFSLVRNLDLNQIYIISIVYTA
jgi:hypothetical protein